MCFHFPPYFSSSSSPLPPSLPPSLPRCHSHTLLSWQRLRKSFLCARRSKLTRLPALTPRGEDLELSAGSAAWPSRASSSLHVILLKSEAEGPSSARQQGSDGVRLNPQRQIQEDAAPSEPGSCGRTLGSWSLDAGRKTLGSIHDETTNNNNNSLISLIKSSASCGLIQTPRLNLGNPQFPPMETNYRLTVKYLN